LRVKIYPNQPGLRLDGWIKARCEASHVLKTIDMVNPEYAELLRKAAETLGVKL
jgi:hypothetical protein